MELIFARTVTWKCVLHLQISTYKKMSEQLADFNHLNRMHYDLKRGQYLDWGNHTEDVRLDWRYVQVKLHCFCESQYVKFHR